jgi:hypothetical protein
MKIFAMMIVDVEDFFEDRKPTLQMVKKYLVNRVSSGVVNEDYFRGKVIMKINHVRVAIMEDD